MRGTIVCDVVGSRFRVDFRDIGYFGGPPSVGANYRIELDASNSNVLISNLSLPPAAWLQPTWIGVHPGGAATIEPGIPATFVGTGTFTSAVPGFAHGVFGDLSVGPLTDPVEQLVFTWNLAGGYAIAY